MRGIFKPPTDLQQVFNTLAEPFGGAAELSALLDEKDIEYLLAFPGFVNVVSPWAIEVDLKDYGYVTGSSYAVLKSTLRGDFSVDVSSAIYTQRYENISTVETVVNRQIFVPYPVTSVEVEYLTYPVQPNGFVFIPDFVDGAQVRVVVPAGRFGVNAEDRNLVAYQPHGSYVHLVFDSSTGPVTGILLICNRRPFAVRQRLAARWQEQVDAAVPHIDAHELFLYLDCLQGASPITVTFVPGDWKEQLSYEQLIQHPNRILYTHPANTPLVLNFPQPGWLTFTHQGVQLVIQDIRGVGVRRLRETLDCTYYIQLHDQFLAAPHPRLPARPSLLTGSSWAGSEGFLRAEATLAYRFDRFDKDKLDCVFTFASVEEERYQTDHLAIGLRFLG